METRVKRLIDLAKPPNRVLLYFTDIAFLPTAGSTLQSKDSIGSFLAPLMERGDLVLCGECTSEQYRLTLENNPTFNKLFETMRLEEVDQVATRQIVTEVAADYERRALEEQALLLSIPERTQQAVVELSLDYFPGRVYPGKALHLLQHVVESELTRWHEGGCAAETLSIGPEAAIAALGQITGIPGQLLDDTQPLDLNDVCKFFEARVIGQREATEAIVDLITLVKAGLTDPYKPMGVFLFVGPTGVGKTELARTVAEFIFGHPDRLIRYDMSEYKDYASFEKLIGNPQAQDQSPMRRGSLVSRVQQQPFSVILFDEIEKAHPNIFDLFLQLFDAGRLADAVGQVTSFKKTIVIMTSNVGSNLARPASFGFRAENEQVNMSEQIGDAHAKSISARVPESHRSHRHVRAAGARADADHCPARIGPRAAAERDRPPRPGCRRRSGRHRRAAEARIQPRVRRAAAEAGRRTPGLAADRPANGQDFHRPHAGHVASATGGRRDPGAADRRTAAPPERACESRRRRSVPQPQAQTHARTTRRACHRPGSAGREPGVGRPLGRAWPSGRPTCSSARLPSISGTSRPKPRKCSAKSIGWNKP